MPVVNMTARFLETLKPGAAAVEWFDEDTRGLSLKLNPGGAATWYFNYTRRADALRRRVQIGKLAALGLKDARLRATKMAGLVADGKDPAGDRRAEREALTVDDLAEQFLTQHADEKRTGKRQRQALAKDVLPIIGRAKAAAVTRRDIGRIVDRMTNRGVTIGASRTFEIVRKMFNWALQKGLLEQNPCLGMKKPFATRRRDRVLSPDEIRTIWNGLPTAAISADGQQVLKLCLITAQRLGEVAGMCSDELNLEAGVWTIPAWRSKNGHAHRVPLTDMAREIIGAAKAARVDGIPIPGLRQGRCDQIVERRQGGAPLPHQDRVAALDGARSSAHRRDRDGRSWRRAACDRPRAQSSRRDRRERHRSGL